MIPSLPVQHANPNSIQCLCGHDLCLEALAHCTVTHPSSTTSRHSECYRCRLPHQNLPTPCHSGATWLLLLRQETTRPCSCPRVAKHPTQNRQMPAGAHPADTLPQHTHRDSVASWGCTFTLLIQGIHAGMSSRFSHRRQHSSSGTGTSASALKTGRPIVSSGSVCLWLIRVWSWVLSTSRL